jgi:phosphate/sulfate permease
MSIDPIMAAVLAAVILSIAGVAFYRIRAGHVRHGEVVYTSSDQPAEFWFSVLFPTAAMLLIAVAMATDMGSNDFRFDQSVTWVLGMVLIGFLLIRALQTGYAGGHRISFARREEPREFWIIILLYGAAEALATFMLFQVLSVPPG